MKYNNLLVDGQVVNLRGSKSDGGKPSRSRNSKSRKEITAPRGCKYCPLGDQKRKGCPSYPIGLPSSIFRTHKSKPRYGLILGLAPYREEHRRGLEFLGRSGKLLWRELSGIGIQRDDVHIQNTVRCCPFEYDEAFGTWDPNTMPTPEVFHACSFYNDKIIPFIKSEVAAVLVLGEEAAKRWLGKNYHRDRVLFWHEEWQCYVICAEHPAYFVRQGDNSSWRFFEWRDKLKAFRECVGTDAHRGRWAYVLAPQREYKGLYRYDEAKRYLTDCRRQGRGGARISIDIEEGWVEDKYKILMVGLAYGHYEKYPTYEITSRSIVLDHPENRTEPREKERIKALLKTFLADDTVPKVFHHGSSDVTSFRRQLGVMVKHYDFDTEYASYLKYPFQRKHGLNAIAHTFFPEFADYKSIPEEKGAKSDNGSLNYATVPLEFLVPYNCADAALTKIIEIKTTRGDKNLTGFDSYPVSDAYVEVMTNAAFTVAAMESRGPLLDTEHHRLVASAIPPHVKRLLEKIQLMVADPKFNPSSSVQVAKILYDQLDFSPVDDKHPRATDKETLAILAQNYNHALPKDIILYRKLRKMTGTYLDGSKRSAEMHSGEVRTRWYMTGTSTTRFSSGGERNKDLGLMNLQNWHGDPFLKNLLVSTLDWRKILHGLPKQVLDMDVFYSPDYSQAELRMLAQASKDSLLIKQFNSGVDIHSLVGHALTGWSVKEIMDNPRTRRLVKNMHFGIVYGISRNSMFNYLRGKGVETTEEESTKYYDGYFLKYKGVSRFIDYMRDFVEANGYAYNIFGFRRPLSHNDLSRNTSVENQAINTPIQSASHTLMLAAMALLHLYPERYPDLAQMIMEVHDSFVFVTSLRKLAATHEQARRLMVQDVTMYIEERFGVHLRIPLLVDSMVGFRYGVMIDYDGEPIKEVIKSWKAYNAEVESKSAETYMLAA